MRRLLTTALTSAALLAASALPALATEPSSGTEVAKGSMTGILLALVFGLLFGIGVVIHAYRGVAFGEAEGHHERAHDTREGLGGHNAPEPGVEDMPTGGGA